jgi:hypothetical protein
MEKDGRGPFTMAWLERRNLVPAPVDHADTTTAGFGLLFVLDCDSGDFLQDCVAVDCAAGTVLRRIIPGGRAHPFQGRFMLTCKTEDAWMWMEDGT